MSDRVPVEKYKNENDECVEIGVKGKKCTHKATVGDICTRHHLLRIKKAKKLLENPPVQREDPYCVEIGNKGKKRCTFKAVKGDLCTMHHNKRIMKQKALELNEKANETDGICVEIGNRGRCTRKSKVGKLCQYHHNFRLKKKGEFIEQIDPDLPDNLVKICAAPSHKYYGSKYIRERVPLEEFRKSPENPTDLHDTCSCCREYARNMGQKRRKKLSELNQNRTDQYFKACQSLFHDTPGVCPDYPRERVPIEMFAYKSKNKKDESNSCICCREFRDARVKSYTEKYKKETEKNGKFYCLCCNKKVEAIKQAINLDGSKNNYCIECRGKKNEYGAKHTAHMKNVFRTIQKEFMEVNECSCERCKCILVKPEDGGKYVVELPTYEEDDIRLVIYKGEVHTAADFIQEYEDILEFRTMEFDHLTEAEQRERGIIGDGEEYIRKKNCVSAMQNEYSMRKESEITQQLCCKCHLIVTIERELGNKWLSPEGKKKLEYANNLKKEFGCEVCKFKDDSLLRYLEFDHLFPADKIDCISRMVQDDKYTLENLIEECKKCRILCRSCHKIHSDHQRKQMKDMTVLT